MRKFERLLIYAVSVVLYAACYGFPSAKATATAQYNYGTSMSRSTGNHLFVTVRVNNRPAWFAVDTGAALSIVDTTKAKTLGLSKELGLVQVPRQIEVNNRTVPVAMVDSLYVGSDDLGSGPVALIDLRDFRAKLRGSGHQVTMDGIIGLDILQRYNAIIDCRNQRIYLETRGDNAQAILKRTKTGRYNAVPMRITHSGALEVEGRIGRNRYSFVVDTGGFATLVPSAVAQQNGIPVIRTTVNAKGIHSKERPVGLTIAPEFDLGNHALGPAMVGVTGLPEGPEDLRFPFGGLIGADFFFERGGIIDVGGRTLYFK
jgi:predicted aspartyl protease